MIEKLTPLNWDSYNKFLGAGIKLEIPYNSI